MKKRVSSSPLDIQITKLLGKKPSRFLVICFDGVQADFLGTPIDTPANRKNHSQFVAALNDKTDQSLWRESFARWKDCLCRQFKLPPEITSDSYRPKITCEISVTCPAYSKHDCAAISLMQQTDAFAASWSIVHFGTYTITITGKNGSTYIGSEKTFPLAVAETVLTLLEDTVSRKSR